MAHTRRDVVKLTPQILGRYHDLLMSNDLEAFKTLLDEYSVPQEAREELVEDFTRVAANLLRRRWLGRK